MATWVKFAIAGIGLTAVGLSQNPKPRPISPVAVKHGVKPMVSPGDLVGRYYFGDGLGVNCYLELKGNGEFDFSWHGCLGEYDRNHGTWRQVGDLVILDPKDENRHEGFEGVNTRFVPIVLDKHLFLVDEYEVPGFLAGAHEGDLYGLDVVHGHDYIRLDEKSDPMMFLRPDAVPTRFKIFLERGAFRLRVTSIREDGAVILETNAKGALWPGLMLAPREWYSADLEIVSVSNTIVARPGYFFNSNRPVKVGDVYSTGGKWLRPHGTGWPRSQGSSQKK